jgi:uncharacterized membrane protein YedE/YeeE
MSTEPAPDPAKSRFIVIQAVRWTGALLVMLGLLVAKGKLGLPHAAGYGFVFIGLAAALVVPTLLARRWKSR